jgi:ABC-type nitrate/sulfonate/bicarbonate transport system permease component
MSQQARKYLAPVVVLMIILILWQGLVILFDIQQFLLPKPTAILSNLVRAVILLPGDEPADVAEIETALRAATLIVSLPQNAPPESLEGIRENTVFRLPLFEYTFIFTKGPNLIPIVQASLYTLREALSGFGVGCGLGILTAMATARWTTTREALMPFAIAANSMPIIAFAPIMNNWFGIDNPTSKIAIVAIMIFFPMMINTVRGLTLVEPRSLELMRSYAAGEFEILLKLRIPNALPYIFNGFYRRSVVYDRRCRERIFWGSENCVGSFYYSGGSAFPVRLSLGGDHYRLYHGDRAVFGYSGPGTYRHALARFISLRPASRRLEIRDWRLIISWPVQS